VIAAHLACNFAAGIPSDAERPFVGRRTDASRVLPMLEAHALHRLHLGPIDFSVAAGECVSVTGKSGVGKTVLLRMIADLDPHKGDATLDGEACSAMPAPRWRRMVTYVAAEFGWWDETVAAHF